jgi:hypothetical protein
MDVRRVTSEELQPAGWVCESCLLPFAVGDAVFGVIQAIGHLHDDDDELTVMEGLFRCAACFHLDVAVVAAPEE